MGQQLRHRASGLVDILSLGCEFVTKVLRASSLGVAASRAAPRHHVLLAYNRNLRGSHQPLGCLQASSGCVLCSARVL